MSKMIQNHLNQLAEKHSIQILYAVESGSRAWGFASIDSDFDVRFIYHYHRTDYLRFKKPAEVIDLMDGIYDFHGWDIYKACHLFQKGNPTLNEWLYSPIIYQEQKEFANSLRKLLTNYFSAKKAGYHYLSIAKKHLQKHMIYEQKISRKALLYTIRTILCTIWIDQFEVPPPVKINQLLELSIPSQIHHEIVQLIQIKKQGAEKELYQPSTLMLSFLEEQIQTFTEKVDFFPSRLVSNQQLDSIILRLLEEEK